MDKAAPIARRVNSGQGAVESVLVYPDGTEVVQRFTQGPSTGHGPVSSVTVSLPAPRTVDGHIVPDGRFWRVDLPDLDLQIPVRFLEHARQIAQAAAERRLQLPSHLVELRLFQDGKPFTPTPAQMIPDPTPAPTVTYR